MLDFLYMKYLDVSEWFRLQSTKLSIFLEMNVLTPITKRIEQFIEELEDDEQSRFK